MGLLYFVSVYLIGLCLGFWFGRWKGDRLVMDERILRTEAENELYGRKRAMEQLINIDEACLVFESGIRFNQINGFNRAVSPSITCKEFYRALIERRTTTEAK